MGEYLGNMKTLEAHNIPVYCDGRIAFIDHLQDVPQEYPVQLDSFLVIVCLRGFSRIDIDGRTFEVSANQMLICHPNIVLENGMASPDLQFRCICLSRDYLQQLPIVGDANVWDVVLFLEKSPVLPLSGEDIQGFCQYYDLLRSKLTGTPRRHQKEILDALLLAFLYEFRDVLEQFIDIKPQAYTAANSVFRRFLELLTSTYPKPRSVAWYADKLCLTPKYLSTVCKEASGETAGELINRYVVKDVDILLKKRGKSIKEICNELEFPNLSFFGRYVKKHLGLSPKQYREKIWGQ